MLKTRKIIKNLILSIMCMALVLSTFSVSVLARDLVDVNKKASLTIEYLKNYDITGVEFNIYKLADVSRTGEFTVSDAFKSYPVDLDKENNSEWLNLAETLDAYVLRDNITPTRTELTDDNSRATFTDLSVGMYLVIGEAEVKKDGVIYKQTPFIISLPNLNDKEEWVYDITTYSKYEKDDDFKPNPDVVDRKVLKVWADSGNEEVRPASIEVELLRDGLVYDVVELNEGNNWRYKWNNLSTYYKWRVVERDVPGYAVSVEQKGITFKIVNTYTTTKQTTTGGGGDISTTTRTTITSKSTEPTTTTTTDGKVEGTSDVVTTTAVSTDPDVEIDPDEIPQGNRSGDGLTLGNDLELPEENIPQAGMLWWPVPVLICAGVLMFIIGIIKKNRA